MRAVIVAGGEGEETCERGMGSHIVRGQHNVRNECETGQDGENFQESMGGTGGNDQELRGKK